MLLIHWVWAIASLVVIAAVYGYIRYREIEARWGDLQGGAAFERARQSLLRLEEGSYHPKNWRPILLALSGSAWMRPNLPIYGYWLTAGHGILTLAQVVHGDVEDHAERRDNYEQAIRKFIAKEELQAFPAVVVARVPVRRHRSARAVPRHRRHEAEHRAARLAEAARARPRRSGPRFAS